MPAQEDYPVVPAEPHHLAVLAEIERAAASLFPEGTIPELLREATVPQALLAQGQAEGRLWVAQEGGGMAVGFALVEVLGGIALLAELDVLPSLGRRGIGRRLIAAARDWAEARGHDALYLTTFADIPWNAPYYARLGFRPLEEAELHDELIRRLKEEKAFGLADRVAMQLRLGPVIPAPVS
ncbi:GNAT family N-acetyltransferase [Pseudomonas sp. No.21]|uniref:GNAT family N-acetyltransferase n=3 Tax=Pseudomonas TaxID=286 RepID=UPI001F30A528|nr:GNAT family N-acetyltransferase [Pseudomonas tohonis]GJN49246.1 GCN5 family N-acetyltransferase [Pseudomonas tohonis]